MPLRSLQMAKQKSMSSTFLGEAVPGSVPQAMLLESLGEIALKMNSNTNPDAVLRSIVESVIAHSPWHICSIFLVDAERKRTTLYADAGFAVGYSSEEILSWPVDGSPTLHAVQSGQPLCIPDVLEEDRYPLIREDARRQGYRSALLIPVNLGESCAVLWFCAPVPRGFNRHEIAYASAIGAQAAAAIRASRLLSVEHEMRNAEVERRLEIEHINQLVVHQNSLLERLIASHSRLIEMVLAERGLTALADAAAKLLGNPVLLFDRFDHLLARSANASDHAGRPEGEPGLQDQLRRISQQRRAAIWAGQSSQRSILTPVLAGRALLGYLYVPESERQFEELDTVVAEQVALLAALELMKERIRLEAELRLKIDFVDALLSNQSTDVSELRQRAALLGLDLARPQQVVLAEIDSLEQSVGDATPELPALVHELVSTRVAQHASSAVCIVHGGGRLVVIAPGTEPAGPAPGDALASLMQSAIEGAPPLGRLGSVTLSIGVGRPHDGAAGVRASYAEARKALQVIRAMGQRNTVLPFERVGIYQLLVSDNRPDGVLDFVRPLLQPLMDYDRRRNTALVPTLEAFLESGCNVHQAARALYVHVTTVRYRLERIEDVLGISLSDAETRLNLHLALKIHRLTGLTGEAVG
jgi:DNA-binding PucR family transcriptional regulator